MPSIVTRPVITSMAPAIRLNWRTVVAVTWGWRQWKSVTISTIGEFRCGLRVVVLHNATLHDNGPPHLIFGEGIVSLNAGATRSLPHILLPARFGCALK